MYNVVNIFNIKSIYLFLFFSYFYLLKQCFFK